MRQKRAKAYRKLMSLYCMTFGFRQPYQVLVDSEVCRASVAHKISLAKQLETVLQGAVKPMITQCCIHQLYLQGETQQPAVDLAKTFERRKCNHREAIPGDECLASVVGETNKHRYVIATQSQELRSKLRTVPAVPLVHINRSVMVLEPPSQATLDAKEFAEEQTLHPSTPEIATLLSTSITAEPPKKKGPKGPNPLSVKKKKVKTDLSAFIHSSSQGQQDQAGLKRKRVVSDDPTPKEAVGRKRRRRHKGNEASNEAEAASSIIETS